MPRRFSRSYETYEDWLAAERGGSPYTRRLTRGHALRPSATLSQLRRHPRSRQRPISTVPKVSPSRIPIAQLTFKEQRTRSRALEVLSGTRRGRGSLSGLAQKKGIAPKTARKYTRAFRKKGSRWFATRQDQLERWLKSYEGGYRTEVLVKGSRTASLLSRYANAVARYREAWDPSGLAEFIGKSYVDTLGKTHTFETDPVALRAAFERAEEDFGAFATIYYEHGEVDESS
ncbi:MAG: hypothetical protein ACREDK_06980 [Thermoplasmata archaeon]